MINLKLFVFQVRPLIIKSTINLNVLEHSSVLSEIETKYASLSKYHPYLLGKKSLFGVMPDWNPAEIIGVRPRPLALSLYKEWITDGTWAYREIIMVIVIAVFSIIGKFCWLTIC